MGLLSWLFGQTTTNQATNHQPPRTWSVSEAGNDTAIFGEYRVTIFPDGSGWKFCVAIAADDDDPYFSYRYNDRETARRNAFLFLRGEPTEDENDKDARREAREQQDRAISPEILSLSQQKLDEMERAVLHFRRLKSQDDTKRARLIARLNKARDQTQHLHHRLISCDAPQEILGAAARIPLRIVNLKADVGPPLKDRTLSE